MDEIATGALAMGTNRRKQEQCWSTIVDTYDELHVLSQEAVRLVQRRTELMEERRRRGTVVKEEVAMMRHRLEVLQHTIQNCEVSDEITDKVSEAVSTLCNTLDFHVKNREKLIDSIGVTIHKDKLELFRASYLTMGELVHRKRQNLLRLHGRVDAAEKEHFLNTESLNPMAKESAQRVKQLKQEAAELEGDISQLQSQSDTMLLTFKPTEEALQAAGVPFKHPQQLLQEMNAGREQKILDYQTLTAKQLEDTDDGVAAAEATVNGNGRCKALEDMLKGPTEELAVEE
eukprot:NODE_521_length_1402_cov_48.847059_g486_i0.p1 GENE.NODE_521_length_1402_cov_48.847059_g486_i0~~NODE_521_length_1402_cov_48.847059_g486_i0.p1  ORF type:complete len:288 (+),score=56.08 NODE_521_length_1402_cov_48.847059_g486_i0:449-1312(+)